MLEDILIPFFTIALAEIGDKTQLAVLTLSSRTNEHGKLLLGVMAAFVLSTALAVIFGDLISLYVPIVYVKIIAGLAFIYFGITTFLNHEKEAAVELKDPFTSAFTLVFISEMGDKTQLGAALFATRFNPIFVFIGSVAALFVLSAAAIYVGKFLATKINRKLISQAGAILFVILGLGFIFL
ncbi:MAG: TMEM165/GDT1 family protein [Candidatus Micrarchaeota archaeon]